MRSIIETFAVGTRTATDELVTLSSIIDRLNELFGTDFSDNDRLFLDHMVEAGKAVQSVQERATANTYENFALSIKELLQNLMIDGLEKHEQLATRYLNDPEFKQEIDKTVAQRIYDDLRKTG